MMMNSDGRHGSDAQRTVGRISASQVLALDGSAQPDYISRLILKPKEWHERRRRNLGASDANVIMNGTDADLVHLWRVKRGEAEPEDLSSKIPVLIGTLTEPLNVALFARRSGLIVSRQGEAIQHPGIPMMTATLDGFIVGENAILECKHCGDHLDRNQILERYWPQLHHAMACAMTDKAFLSVLQGNSEYWYTTVKFDPFYFESLVLAESDFWQHVMDGTPPKPIPSVPIVTGEPSRIVDMSQTSKANRWAASAADFLANKEQAKCYEKAKKDLKEMVEFDVIKAYSFGVEVIRDRRGLTVKG